MKKTIISLLIVLTFVAAQAQNIQFELTSIRNEPLKGIKLLFLKKQWVSDSLGKIAFTTEHFNIAQIELWQEDSKLEYTIATTANVNSTVKYKLIVYYTSIEAAVVKATRNGTKEPYQTTTIHKAEIQLQNTGRDLPILLQLQPSVVITSDAGAGVGYTGIRVRGSDASRTNVTLNGVPINDAESQGTFWVNMPDMAASLQSVQLQAGVGSSTNGAGAFGASIHMQTQSNSEAFGNVSQSIGTFGTRKTSIGAGTGLINKHWIMDMRLSSIQSNGFIDRANSNLQSWNMSVAYINNRFQAKLMHFGGKENTYQAWWGIPIEKYNGNAAALNAHYNRNIGVSYRNTEDSINLFNSNSRTYNYYTYPKETDNYTQKHYHLYADYKINQKSRLNTTLYGTWGAGYYEQFKPQDALIKYALKPLIIGNDTVFNSDIVRRRWLDNRLLGINTNYFYEYKDWQITIGTGINRYFGDHFGEIIWANTAPTATLGTNYYNSNGQKTDANAFIKANWKIAEKLYISADMQLRKISHTGFGSDNDLRRIQFSKQFTFFNPKAGLVYKPNMNERMFVSISRANREPSRSDFVDNINSKIPNSEQLTDVETGYSFENKKLQIQANFYFMYYKNQLVLTGKLNDVGTPLRTNVDKSYRTGIETKIAYNLHKYFILHGNITFSKNKIHTIYNQTLNYTDYSYVTDTLTNTDIAYSPNITSSAMATVLLPKDISINWVHKYVSRQYLDNSQNISRSLQPYYFQEIWINKLIYLQGNSKLNLQFQILNVFNTLYLNNGYTYSYASGNPGNISRTQEVFVFPSAGRHFMLQASLQF